MSEQEPETLDSSIVSNEVCEIAVSGKTMAPKKDKALWKERDLAPSEAEIEQEISEKVNETLAWTKSANNLSFFEYEKGLFKHILLIGKLFISLFLTIRENDFNRTRTSQAGFKWQKPKSRILGTFFGKVTYWRSYLYKAGRAYYPLDIELGMRRDGFSMLIQSMAVSDFEMKRQTFVF